jgi:hypothetical protein
LKWFEGVLVAVDRILREEGMKRPIRPVGMVILTACVLYPALGFLWQGLYPFIAGETFTLVAQMGPWLDLAAKYHIPLWVPSLLKAGLGGAWAAGVLGLWAGDGRALPLVVLAAIGTLLYPGGGMLMAVLALIVVFAFRENEEFLPA